MTTVMDFLFKFDNFLYNWRWRELMGKSWKKSRVIRCILCLSESDFGATQFFHTSAPNFKAMKFFPFLTFSLQLLNALDNARDRTSRRRRKTLKHYFCALYSIYPLLLTWQLPQCNAFTSHWYTSLKYYKIGEAVIAVVECVCVFVCIVT